MMRFLKSICLILPIVFTPAYAFSADGETAAEGSPVMKVQRSKQSTINVRTPESPAEEQQENDTAAQNETESVQSSVNDEELWSLYEQGKTRELRERMQLLMQQNPGWQPSEELLSAIRQKDTDERLL